MVPGIGGERVRLRYGSIPYLGRNAALLTHCAVPHTPVPAPQTPEATSTFVATRATEI